MIDTYGDRQNPCTFCGENDENSTKKDYLEFSLCGNNTTLFVREVSVEDISTPKEDEILIDEIPETPGQTPSKVPSNPVTPTVSVKNMKKSSPFNISSHNNRLDALNTKKWSGQTYFEEEIRRLRDQQYENELKQAMKMRKMWHKFQKDILKDRRADLVKSSGPEWWQEPSTKQVVLATTLKDVIKADYEEEVTGRTRQWLLDLGVSTRLTSRQVRTCMKRCMLEPVDFLLEAHSLIVKSQSNVKKKGQLQKPFTSDERLLLTAVCVLQLPTLLTMLHYMLPPPKTYPASKHMEELLYGDLDDETIRYATPYMEPLPFRNMADFEDWAFGKICTALLPILLQDDHNGPYLKKSEFSERITSDVKRSLSISSQTHSPNRHVSAHSNAPSVALLLSYCLSKRRLTVSLTGNLDEDSVSKRTFGRRLSLLGKSENYTKPTEPFKCERSENIPQISQKTSGAEPAVKDTVIIATNKDNSTQPLQEYSEEFTLTNQSWQTDHNQPVPSKDLSNPYSGPQLHDDSTYDQLGEYSDVIGTTNKENGKTLSRMKPVENDYLNKTSSKQTVGQNSSEESFKGFNTEQEAHGSLSQLETIWEEIKDSPEKEQLQKAIRILKEMGDPLAQLPRIEKLPTIQRWLELRRGKNRLLSKEFKEELLKRSRGMWKSVHFNSLTRGPKVAITKREERKLAWDKKKWLESEIRKEKDDYFSRLRQEKVDNARAFFPTMLNHYDYGSKLNRNFRDVFYTYLPAREADTFAYRPWQPQETRHS